MDRKLAPSVETSWLSMWWGFLNFFISFIFVIIIWLIYRIILVSNIQHCDLTITHIAKWSPCKYLAPVTIKMLKYYWPSPVCCTSTPVNYHLFCNLKFIPLYPIHLCHPCPHTSRCDGLKYVSRVSIRLTQGQMRQWVGALLVDVCMVPETVK